jgi:hypothetical protein
MSIVVVGNGESRKPIDLQSLDNHTIIGCNALYRDVAVPHLVCCDMRMVNEAVEAQQDTIIYTRPDWISFYKENSNVRRVPDLPYKGTLRQDELWHWGSGPLALLVACTMESNNISLIGFDLYGSNDKVNNVYKGSKNYLNVDSTAVDPVYWIYQVAKVFEHYPDKYFTVYNTDKWVMPDSWKLANVNFKIIDILQQRL